MSMSYLPVATNLNALVDRSSRRLHCVWEGMEGAGGGGHAGISQTFVCRAQVHVNASCQEGTFAAARRRLTRDVSLCSASISVVLKACRLYQIEIQTQY